METKSLIYALANRAKFIIDAKHIAKKHVIYMDTSSINYIAENVDIDAILRTRRYLDANKKIFLISLVNLWEIMLTSDRDQREYLYYVSQIIFNDRLLASPTDLLVRYMLCAYPKNAVNYSFFQTALFHEFGERWLITTM